MTAAAASAERIGRFELLRVLGRGSQSTVWLARDPRLGREVALKCFTTDDAAAGLGDWLSEARAVAVLNHPHIVPVFEADVHGEGARAQPYVVFEYIAGASLDVHLKQHGACNARAAVERLLGVCEALAQAHAAGLVHRDLKPSNLLIDAAGQARVTDFGIAVKSGVAALAAGSPRYAAPETIRGEPPTPRVDVFALGLLICELLLGRALVADKDVPAILKRIAQSDLALPAQTAHPVDDGLRAIVQRALSRDAAKRYADAGELAAALRAWLLPAKASNDDADAVAAGKSPGSSAALDFLLRRMRHKGDFPALSDSVASIQRIAASEHENLSALSDQILRDVALTHKLLRLVNTAHYKRTGGGVSTVSRAIALMGFAGVRNLALSLVLVEHMNDKAHAQQIKQEFMRALLAGTLAEELCPGALARGGGLEEAFLGAMFQNLGRLLTEFYFPDEAEQVRKLVHPAAGTARSTPRQPVPEAAASASVLGSSYEELGLGVAKSWGLPDNLQRCMRAAGTLPGQPPAALPERLRWLAVAANDVADRLLHHESNDAERQVAEAAERYARVVGIGEREMVAAVARSRDRLSDLARGLEIKLASGSPAERLLAPREAAAPNATPAAAAAVGVSTLSKLEIGPSDYTEKLSLADTPGADREPAEDPAAVLAAGIQDITNSMVEEVKLGELLRMILETMYRALGFRRVLFCLREPRSGELIGRFMLGDGDETLRSAFRISTRPLPGAAPDLLSAVCIKGTDLMVADTAANKLRERLPAWYRDKVDAPTFLLLPLMAKAAPVGLIYADKAQAGSIQLGEKELSLLRTLRNQAVMAFRQAGGG
ncbi:MAG TPA: HDOD domain-containing protein [Methylibium sp.]|uniref:protein kinase domain-containing protein n=1 Tax=Methylibium sp. TaxID=2067992 RepID=UPI002DC05F4D|nr:HDOD domain-containing protein [Methylibium sp.]HEU4457799.1 HDOD domain-containing protein [Methylibium sp.]